MSLGLSFCLTVCLSVSVSVRPSVSLAVCLSFSLCFRSAFFSICQFLWVCYCVSDGPSVHLSVFPSIRHSVCLSIRQSVYLSVYLSIRHFLYLSVCLSVCPTVHLSFHSSVCLYVCLGAPVICVTENPSICQCFFPFNILSVCFSGCAYHLIIMSVFWLMTIIFSHFDIHVSYKLFRIFFSYSSLISCSVLIFQDGHNSNIKL